MKAVFQRVGVVLLALLSLALFPILMVGCDGEGDAGGDVPSSDTYTLTFVTDGGTAISPITAKAGETITPPADPEKEGYTFEGWYENAGFSGVAVELPGVMPERNITYYAKFEEIDENDTATLTLQLGEGGTLDATVFELAVGTRVSDFLQDKLPTPLGDARFEGWYDGANPLSNSKSLPRKGLTLTAKYSVEYTVEVFSWSGNKSDYTPEENEPSYAKTPYQTLSFRGILGEDILQKDIQSALAGKIDASLELDRIGAAKLTLTASSERNIVAAFYKWKTAAVVFMGGYTPTGEVTGNTETQVVWMGERVTLPENGYTAPGNRFAGWGSTAESAKLFAAGESFLAESSTNIFYANWNYGMPDAAGGSDRIYHLRENPTVVLLERPGLPIKEGSYNPEDRSFAFLRDGRGGALVGKIAEDHSSFVYYSADRNATFQMQNWVGVSRNVTLKLDGYDGAIYTAHTSEGTDSHAGVYRYDSDAGCYLFLSQNLEFYFLLDGGEFRMRHALTADRSYLMMTPEGSVYDDRVISLDGFGNAVYRTNTETIYATYTVKADYEGKSVLSFAGEGFPIAECQVQIAALADGSAVNVYELPYTKALTVSIPVDGGVMTLTTNGYDSAEYVIAYTAPGVPDATGVVTYYALGEYNGYYYLAYASGLDPATGYESIHQLRVREGAGEGEWVGDESGIYYEGVSKGAYTVGVTLYADPKSNYTGGYAVLELLGEDGSYITVATGRYLALDGKTLVFRFELSAVSPMYAEVASYYNALPFCVYPNDSSFILQEDEAVTSYTFTQNGKIYTLTCDGFGMATLQDNISTKHVRYAMFEGYNGYGFLIYTSESVGSALIRFRTDGEGVGAIEAETVDAVFGTQGIYADRFERLAGDQAVKLYYDGYMQIMGKDSKGDYTVILAEGMCRQSTTAGIYHFDGAPGSAYEDLQFATAHYGEENWFLPYRESEKAVSSESICPDGSGLLALGDGSYYHYVILSDCVKLYALEDLDGEPVYILDLQNGKIEEPTLMGTYYLYENESIGTYAILFDGRGNAILKLLSLEGAYIDIIDPKLAVGTYVLSDKEADCVNVTFGGEYASLSGLFRLFVYDTICIYVPGNYDNEREYTLPDGGSIRVDAFNMVIYTTPDGYNDPAWEAYLQEIPNAIGDRTVVLLEVISWEGNVANIVMYGEYIADGNALTPITSIYGSYAAYQSGTVDRTATLTFDGRGGVSDGLRTGIVTSGEAANEYHILWSDGRESKILLVAAEDGEIVYAIYDAAHNRTAYEAETWETRIFDGYGNVLAIDALGNVRVGHYQAIADGTYSVLYTDGTSETVQLSGETFLAVNE